MTYLMWIAHSAAMLIAAFSHGDGDGCWTGGDGDGDGDGVMDDRDGCRRLSASAECRHSTRPKPH